MTQTLPSIDLKSESGAVLDRGTSVDSVEGSVDDRQTFKREAGPADIGVLPQRTLDASIVVPYYNPGGRLRPTVERLVRELGATGMSFEIITVSDGSTDGSSSTLDGLPEGLVRSVSYATNVGKGHAVRTGFGLGRGRYLGFIDADGDILLEFLASFMSVMDAENPDMIIGSKRHPDSSVRQSPLRRIYSPMHQNLNRLLFRLNVKDTQAEIELVDRRVVDDVLPLLRENRFAFDIELLVVAQRLGYTTSWRYRHIRAPWEHHLTEVSLAPSD